MNNEFVSTEFKELFSIMEAALANGQKTQFTVTGTSMFPLFSNGRDTVVIARVPEYKKRDIIFYIRNTGDFVLHRIVDKKNDNGTTVFSLCGDNQYVAETPIYEEQIIGKVVGFIRKGKSYTINHFGYRLYSFLWCTSLSVRPYIINPVMAVYKKIVKLKNKKNNRSAK